MLDAKNVLVTETGRNARERSTEPLRPRSARKGNGIWRRVSPAASVSSVSGVGAKNPCPAETRLPPPPHPEGGGDAARPPLPAQECGETRTEERAVLVVEVRSGACRDGELRRDCHVVLQEH